MTTQATFLDNLRTRVNDPSSSRWDDDELLQYLSESVLRYSKLFPRLKETEFTPDGTSTRYPVPADLLDRRIVHIWELDADLHLKEILPNNLRSKWQTRFYDLIDDDLIFGYIPASTVTMRLRYDALHTFPDTGDSTVPSEDEDLIYLWAQVLAWRKIEASDAALSRWKEVGKRDDNPIKPYSIQLSEQYDRQVEEKKAGGRFLQLERAPRRRLRWGTVLY